MVRRIRIPGLIDLVLVDDPSDIRALDDNPRIDRNFIRRGPLLNRLIVGRLRRWFEIAGAMLPSFLPRVDGERVERRNALADRLTPTNERLWSEAQLDRLSGFVRGQGSREDAAVIVQEIVGRLFFPDYVADRTSWEAAETIDEQSAGVSLSQLLRLVTGRAHKARKLLVERARNDRWAMHGTAIGGHGIVHALERMRILRSNAEAAALGDDAVLARCLRPPRQVPRTVETTLSHPSTGELRPGAMILLRLERAWPAAPDAEMIFMRGHWNACPAAAFVAALVLAVWRRSAEDRRS
ncbi:MAG: hypothetical protein R3D62_11565 [Xanthobacteraceae bacterium]